MASEGVPDLSADQWLGIGAFILAHVAIVWAAGPTPLALLGFVLLWASAAVLVYALKE